MKISIKGARTGLLSAISLTILASAYPSRVYAQERQDYDIPAQDLSTALDAISSRSGRAVMFPSNAVAGKRASALRGSYTTEEAIRILLAGTDLVADTHANTIIIRGRSEPPGEIVERPAEPTDIVVTGSRIQGAPISSPVIQISQEQMRIAGQNSLADVVRDIPQNFNGGQNPGVGLNVPESKGSYIGASTGLNLRGLGGDATLTLLNGRRLSYNASLQSIDISAIPFGIVDRIEVVADGASALYGLICPLLSGPKSLLFWTTKELGNGQEAQAGGDYRQAA